LLPIHIGVSSCLLGNSVRYDARSKNSSNCLKLSQYYQLVPVCPEVGAGLSVPRAPVELVQYDDSLRVLGRDDTSLDVTQVLTDFCDKITPSLHTLSGFVLTPRSPSCGYQSTAVKSKDGRLLSSSGNGVFARSLIQRFPSLPIIEEPCLSNERESLVFQLKVSLYYLVQQRLLSSYVDKKYDEEQFLIAICQAKEGNEMNVANDLLDKMKSEDVQKLLIQLREL